MNTRSYLEADHRRLEALLKKSAGDQSGIDHAAYHTFRQGLLEHIGIEEKLLFPEAQKRKGISIERAAKLRLDHGAIAALLVLEPSLKVLHALEVILNQHNSIEEGQLGVYEECEEILGMESEAMLEKVRQFPPVPVAKRIQSEQLWNAARRCLERAGFSGSLLD